MMAVQKRPKRRMRNFTGAYHCTICALDWPLEKTYQTCKRCGEKCSPISNVDAMPAEEVHSLVSQLKFEAMYEKRDIKRNRRLPRDPNLDSRFTLEGWKAEIAAQQAQDAPP